jgi:hypothetical protein
MAMSEIFFTHEKAVRTAQILLQLQAVSEMFFHTREGRATSCTNSHPVIGNFLQTLTFNSTQLFFLHTTRAFHY